MKSDQYFTRKLHKNRYWPGETKPLLYSTDGTWIDPINNDTLSEEILTQEEQEPFWSVEELKPCWTKSQPAVWQLISSTCHVARLLQTKRDTGIQFDQISSGFESNFSQLFFYSLILQWRWVCFVSAFFTRNNLREASTNGKSPVSNFTIIGLYSRETGWRQQLYLGVIFALDNSLDPTVEHVDVIKFQSCIINQEQWKNSHWFWHRARNINFFFILFSVIIGLCCQYFSSVTSPRGPSLFKGEHVYIHPLISIWSFLMRYGVVTFSASQDSRRTEVNLIQNTVPKSTQYKNKWAYGIFEEWQRQRLVKVPIVEVVGLFKNFDFHQDESLETPLVEMSALSVNYWLTKIVQEL